MDREQLTRAELFTALDAYATTLEPRLARAFTTALDAIRASLSDAQLLLGVQTGDVEYLLSQLDMKGVQMAVRSIVASGAERAMVTEIPGTVRVVFDVLNPKSVSALWDYESRAIQVLRQDIQAGAQQWLQVGLERGWNPKQTAVGLRDIIGLPANLVRATDNYRRLLETSDSQALERALRDKRSDAAVRRAIDTGKPLPAAQVDSMVERYRQRALRVNAETIARTGSMDAVNMGNRLAWQQIVEDGKVEAAALRRFWVVARDERTCERCRGIPRMNPEGRAMDEPFQTPHDGLVMYPTLHFRCRCVIYTRIVEN